ncbi:MAG: alpha/beta hydrolase [Alistipes shahii]|uniref:alpha/beta hydrolase n=1 Tax=Alistipes shahii TaxID=328814 RepID=UPI00399CF16B
MKIRFFVLITGMLSAIWSHAAAPCNSEVSAPRIVPIWNNASAPHDNGLRGDETEFGLRFIGNVTEAVLYIYPAAPDKATGQAAVICPGGGYEFVSMEHEGDAFARWIAEQGITAAVIKYRMPNHHPEVPLEDVEQALRVMKGEIPGAGELSVQRVGIIGFSAGGHLAAMAATVGRVRPDFMVLFYPVITAAKELAHEGSFDNLLGRERTEELNARYSLENRVTETTPPTILFLADDDDCVPALNAVSFYRALKEHGVAASLHIYPSGQHGWGILDRFPYKSAWQSALTDWLQNQ